MIVLIFERDALELDAATTRRDDDATRDDDDATTTRRRAMARVATLAAMVTVTPARAAESPESLYDLTVMQYGKPTPLAAYRGKVSVVVNVASE